MGNPYAPPDPDRQDPPRPWPPADAPGRPVAVAAAPPHRPADPRGTARAHSLVRTTILLLAAALLVAVFPVPWSAASIAFTLVGLVVAIRSAVVATRARAGGALVGSAFVLVMAAGGGLLVGATSLLMMPAELAYRTCQASAVTVSAQDACTRTYQGALDRLSNDLRTASTEHP